MGVDCLGTLSHNLHNKLCCDVHEAGNGHRFRDSQSGTDVEREWP